MAARYSSPPGRVGSSSSGKSSVMWSSRPASNRHPIKDEDLNLARIPISPLLDGAVSRTRTETHKEPVFEASAYADFAKTAFIQRCFHLSLLTTALSVCFDTPNCSRSTFCLTPKALSILISITSESDNFAIGLFCPCLGLSAVVFLA